VVFHSEISQQQTKRLISSHLCHTPFHHQLFGNLEPTPPKIALHITIKTYYLKINPIINTTFITQHKDSLKKYNVVLGNMKTQ